MNGWVLVTGGAGFIGSNLVRALCETGRRVRILDNLSTGHASNLEGLEVDFHRGDLRNPDEVRAAVQGVSAVFHHAALPSVARSVEDPVSTHDVNVTGTLTLLTAARDAGADRLVLASSSSIYGDTPTLPKREDMTTDPLSPYALSKLIGEQYCALYTRLYGIKTYALRYFNVFGPRQDPHSDYAAVIPLFIRTLAENRAPEIHGDGGQTRDFTFIRDVVNANLACLRANDGAAGKVFNVALGDRLSIRGLFDRIAALMGKDLEPVFSDPRPGDVRDSQADIGRARLALNWEPQVSFEEGLSHTIDWFTDGGR